MFAGGQAYKLIMEYVPLGSLKEYLPRHKKVTSLNTLLNYSMQICKVKARAGRASSKGAKRRFEQVLLRCRQR